MAISVDASAARLGGGFSFGRSMTVPTTPRIAPSPIPRAAPGAVRPAPGAAAGAAGAAARGGIGRSLLIGAATALGFMALAHVLGLGEGFAEILLLLFIAAIAMYLLKWMLSGRAPQKYPWEDPGKNRNVYQEMEDVDRGHRSSIDSTLPEEIRRAQTSSFDVPKEFDQENFLHMASAYFTMLQKSWDSGDMNHLANFCTDEMFIELTHQRRQIKGANVTKVISLSSSLAGFETTPDEYIASVLFQGNLVENGEPTKVKEIWNLVKPKKGDEGWLLAGIQQA